MDEPKDVHAASKELRAAPSPAPAPADRETKPAPAESTLAATRTVALSTFSMFVLSGVVAVVAVAISRTPAYGKPLEKLLRPVALRIGSFKLPRAVIMYFHPVSNLCAVALTLVGAYLGFRIRLGADSKEQPLTMAKHLHPRIQAAANGLLLYHAIDGPLSLVLMKKPLLQSYHAPGAVIAVVMLIFQGVLGAWLWMRPKDHPQALRDVHAATGIVVLGYLLFQLVLGAALLVPL